VLFVIVGLLPPPVYSISLVMVISGGFTELRLCVLVENSQPRAVLVSVLHCSPVPMPGFFFSKGSLRTFFFFPFFTEVLRCISPPRRFFFSLSPAPEIGERIFPPLSLVGLALFFRW